MDEGLKLTKKEDFCLRRLARGEADGFYLSKVAAAEGVNRTICKYEWADAPLRGLRGAGLAEHTGETSQGRVHRITQKGRDFLQCSDNKEQ